MLFTSKPYTATANADAAELPSNRRRLMRQKKYSVTIVTAAFIATGMIKERGLDGGTPSANGIPWSAAGASSSSATAGRPLFDAMWFSAPATSARRNASSASVAL